MRPNLHNDQRKCLLDNNKAINKMRNINNDWIWEKGFGLWLEARADVEKNWDLQRRRRLLWLKMS